MGSAWSKEQKLDWSRVSSSYGRKNKDQYPKLSIMPSSKLFTEKRKHYSESIILM